MEKKILKLFILLIGVFFIGISGVKADDIVIYAGDNNYQEINCNNYFTNCSLTAIWKKTTDGEVVYCSQHSVAMPNGGDTRYTWTRSGTSSNKEALGYIFQNSSGGSSAKDYLIAQFAMWYFIDRTTFDKYFDYSTRTCKTGSGTNTSNNTAAIMSLIDGAIDAANNSSSTVTVSIKQNSSSLSLSEDGKYYVGSFTVSASGNDSKITIMFNKSLTGSFLTTTSSATSGNNNVRVNSGSTVYIKVPASSVTESSTLKITAYASRTVPGADTYTYSGCNNCGSSKTYQPLVRYASVEKTGNDSKEFTITYNPAPKKYPVVISKKSTISTSEISGADLVIKDSSKNIVDSWTTDGKVHTSNLEAGTYTLEETKAPDGYTKSNDIITFVVGSDGKITVNGKEVTSLEIKNTPDSIMISKIDSLTSKELEGATLVIKDSKGNIIKTITTTGTPEPISIVPGEYTLEETQAPKGYIKNNDVIKFTITSDNKITINGKETSHIVMKNEPIIVYISKKSINGKTELPGATLTITDKDGKIVKDLDGQELTWKSTTEQKKFHLAAGTYYLSEKIAPKGYELSETILEFTVTSDGKVKMDKKDVDNNLIVYTNTPEAEEVKTGSFLIYIIVIGTIATGLITYFVMRKEHA